MTSSPQVVWHRLIGVAAAALGLIALVITYHPLMKSGPGEAHSLFLIAHGATASSWRFWDLPAAEGPRFLMYYSFVLQHLLAGDGAYSYYLVNVVLLWGACLFVGLFGYRLTRSPVTALLAALLFILFDPLYNTIEWLPARQEPMALMLGLGALLLVMQENVAFGWGRSLAIFALLLLAVFSKEYGLVFVGGVFWYLLTCRRDLLPKVGSACIAVVVILVAARIFLAQGVYQDVLQCEDMGYLGSVRPTCTSTDLADSANRAQMLWNAALGLISQVVPALFGEGDPVLTPYTPWGSLQLDRLRLHDWVASSVFVLLFGVAAIRRMPFLGLCLIMVLANAVLSAPFFRTRNVMFGFAAASVVLAYGAVSLGYWLSRVPLPLRLRAWNGGLATTMLPELAILAAFLTAVVAPQLVRIHSFSEYELERKATPEYVCEQTRIAIERNTGAGRTVDPEAVKRILKANGVFFEECPVFRGG